MRLKMLNGTVILSIALALTACGTSTRSAQPGPQSSQSATAQVAANSRTGTFAGLNDKHVSGRVNVSGTQLVLSDFSSDAGPDLHIYLTTGTDENAVTAGKMLGPVAFDKSSQTFSIAGADASKYTTVLIHCDKAKAVFGAATLS